MLRKILAPLFLLLPGLAPAEVPRVVTDIGPVHSLVSMVMKGLGTPEALLSPGASAHDFALRPSQARALSEADLVVWIGPELTPQLADSLATLAPDATRLTLSAVEGTHLLPFREGGIFAHDHEDHDDHEPHDGHAEEEHSDHGEHDDSPDHAEIAHVDPHLWLDPQNGARWLEVIEAELIRLDPDNADHYHVNAVKAARRIAEAETQARAILEPVRDVPLGVAHDAFQYVEDRFGLTVIGAISDGDASSPGAARLDRLRDAYAETPPACFLSEPGTDTRLLLAIAREAMMGEAMRIAELDAMGATLRQGPDMYPALFTEIATRIADCAAR